MRKHAARVLLGAVLVVMLAASCGENESAEQRAQEALERATGTAPTTERPGGTTTTTAPGSNFEVDTTSGEFPDGWPGSFPVPTEIDVVDSASDGGVLSATLHVTDLDKAEALEFYRAALDDAGFEILDDAAGLTFDAGDYNGNVIVTEGGGLITALLTVVPA